MGKRLTASARIASSPQSIPGIGHNNQEEAERVQLISIISRLSQVDDEIETLQAPVAAARKRRSSIIGLGKAAGFTAKELGRRLEEMKAGSRENAALADREHKHRRWLGIIEPDQAALMLGDSAPQEVKDEAHWKAEGYKAGLRQMVAKPPPECAERFVQAWMHEHGRGLKEVLTANAPKPLVRQQAAADFKQDNPEVDLDAAARKLRNDPEFMNRADDGFEASEEELAGQTLRPVKLDS